MGQHELVVESRDPSGTCLGIFDDDGKTAYAYLRSPERIIGDVWLYNHGAAPDRPEWDDPSNLPFANPKELVVPGSYSPVTEIGDLQFEWTLLQGAPMLRLHIRGELFAVLIPGSRPGWSKLARTRGPLAVPLHEAPSGA